MMTSSQINDNKSYNSDITFYIVMITELIVVLAYGYFITLAQNREHMPYIVAGLAIMIPIIISMIFIRPKQKFVFLLLAFMHILFLVKML